MPNMFGGDQFHPAYNPSTRLGDNEVVVGNTAYIIFKDGRIRYEDVNGESDYISLQSAPKEVQELHKKIMKGAE